MNNESHIVKASDVVVDVNLYCEEIADSFCDFYLRCGRIAVDTKQACLNEFVSGCEGFFEPQYTKIVEKDLLHLSRNGLAACENHLKTTKCENAFYETLGPCSGMWVGHQDIGESCSFNLESKVCVAGSQCAVTQTGCGSCVKEVSTGELCDGDSGQRCNRGNYCVKNADNLKYCQKRKNIGDACVNEIFECSDGSYCGSEQICKAIEFVKVGESCNFERRCPYKSSCLSGSCVLEPTTGEACVEAVPCNKSYCAEGICVDRKLGGISCENANECISGRCDDTQKCTPVVSQCYE